MASTLVVVCVASSRVGDRTSACTLQGRQGCGQRAAQVSARAPSLTQAPVAEDDWCLPGLACTTGARWPACQLVCGPLLPSTRPAPPYKLSPKPRGRLCMRQGGAAAGLVAGTILAAATGLSWLPTVGSAAIEPRSAQGSTQAVQS